MLDWVCWFNSLEVLLAGADVALVALRCHVDQLAQVSRNVGGQTEAGVPDRDDVSVPQDARVCPVRKQTRVTRGDWLVAAGGSAVPPGLIPPVNDGL